MPNVMVNFAVSRGQSRSVTDSAIDIAAEIRNKIAANTSIRKS